jgi:hypothetical protein
MPVRPRGVALLKLFWDRAAAIALVVVAAVVLISGWVSLSAESQAGDQIPYVMSGGIGGLFILWIGTTLWLSADLRDEWRKLDALDASVRKLAETAAAPQTISLPEEQEQEQSPEQAFVRQP